MDGRLPVEIGWAHRMTWVAIISLPSAQLRRQAQEQQAAALGFEPVWITAVGVEDITEADFLSMAFSSRRPLKKTEMASFWTTSTRCPHSRMPTTCAQRLMSKHRQEGVALPINNVSDWRSWQLASANVVQHNVAHHFGVASPIEAGALISRGTNASPRPPALGVLLQMKRRRLYSEVIKLFWKLISIWHHKRAYVPFGPHQRNEN